MNSSSHITDYGLPVTDYPKVSIIILNWNPDRLGIVEKAF